MYDVQVASNDEKSVKLSDCSDGCASFARITSDGNVEIERHEYGRSAHDAFGSDVAYVVKADAGQRDRLNTLLRERLGGENLPNDEDLAILQLLQNGFESYFKVKEWLTNESIPFEQQFDPWA